MVTRVKNTPIGVVYEDGEIVGLNAGKTKTPFGIVVYQKNDDRSKVAIGSSDPQDFLESVLHTATIRKGTCGQNSRVHIYHNWQYTGGLASTKTSL